MFPNRPSATRGGRSIDLTPLIDKKVFGEPAVTVARAMFKLELGTPKDGMCELSGILLIQEIECLQRAFARVCDTFPVDGRSEAECAGQCLLIIAERLHELLRGSRDRLF